MAMNTTEAEIPSKDVELHEEAADKLQFEVTGKDAHTTAEAFTMDDSNIDENSPNFCTTDEFGRPLQKWQHQITIRAVCLAAVIGVVFCLMVMKLGFTVGIIPSLNIAAGLMGFVFSKLLTGALARCGLLRTPFTRQENTVIQTCVVACYGLAFSGGFTNYLVAMDYSSYAQVEGSTVAGVDPLTVPADLPPNVVQPNFGKYVAFMFCTYFIGIMVLVPLRKTFILDYRLTYPSGTATGVIINGFHTPLGEATAKKQVKVMGGFFSGSFLWSMFKWMFSGFGDSCGFDHFPSLGFRAAFWQFYFDFSQTYVGIGMICPHYVTWSIMFGAVLSWGIMWPLINQRAGDWFPADLVQGTGSIRGMKGYQIFCSVALILGDGLYNIVKITTMTFIDLYQRHKALNSLPSTNSDVTRKVPKSVSAVGLDLSQSDDPKLANLGKLRDAIFMKDRIPNWVAVAAYVALVAVAMGVTPQLFPGVKTYYVLVAYLLAPIFAFCNAYGMGLTDWSLLTTYGKVCIFIFAAWGGSQGGIIAGLALCGCMCTVVGAAADLMQDFKTGYLTLSSPRSMFIAQLTGAALGCIIAPATFWLYWSGFNIGDPNGEYPAPFATVFRSMAVLAVEGSSVLPKHCLAICGGLFAAAIVLNGLRDFAMPKKWKFLLPIPMAMAIPFYLGAYFAIDMAVGSVILFVWQRMNHAQSDLYAPVVASALIAGDGVWAVPAAILALAKVTPPVCLWFYQTGVAQKLPLAFPTYH